MKSCIIAFFLFLTMISSSFAQNIWEVKVGQAKVGKATVYCWKQEYDGGPTYAIALKDENVFRELMKVKGKKNYKRGIPAPHIRFTFGGMDGYQAVAHYGDRTYTVTSLKGLANDAIVRKSCWLKEFTWAKLTYREKE
jgi:hypothetical protein